MRILGINDQHNASACLVEDGVVTAALQEERLSRVKNDFCFPRRSIQWVLDATGTDPADIDAVALATHSITAPWDRDALMAWFASVNSPKTLVRRGLQNTPVHRAVRDRRNEERRAAVRDLGIRDDRISFIDHHTAHAAAAYHGSPWKEEKVLVLTSDGEGDGLCASVRVGEAGVLYEPLTQIHKSHSIGLLYSMITFLLGMVPYEHEYKLMGLAPYAPASGTRRAYDSLADLFERTTGGLAWRRTRGVPDMAYSLRFLERRLRFQRFDGIAAGLQQVTEEVMVSWAKAAIEVTGIHRVALGGGVFMNVKLNKLISELDEVEDLFVFPSCGDETNSMGAAYQVHAGARAKGADLPYVRGLDGVYWGPALDPQDVASEGERLRAAGHHVEHHDDIEDRVAQILAEGGIVARAKGPMEFGARALGNRSILADPTRQDAVRIINEMVKNRDFWMPFAPSMLEEASQGYLVNPKKIPAPYMILAFDTTDGAKDMPAALHPYDGTARPQIVSREANPDYHRLISRFQARTGRGVVLNTSFNLHGYPIACSARDAADVFERSGLQYLALNQLLIAKRP